MVKKIFFINLANTFADLDRWMVRVVQKVENLKPNILGLVGNNSDDLADASLIEQFHQISDFLGTFLSHRIHAFEIHD